MGKGLRNYRSITPLSAPMVRCRSSGGIAVLFRRQAGRQINLTEVGIEARGGSGGSRKLHLGVKTALRSTSQQTLLVGGFLIGYRCQTLPPPR